MPDKIDFIVNGTLYAVSVDLITQLLSDKGMSLHSSIPLAVIDKVGFLQTGEDSKKIVGELLEKYIEDTNNHPQKSVKAYTGAHNHSVGDPGHTHTHNITDPGHIHEVDCTHII